MLTFAFMHYPYLVCILFGMPSLHLFTFLMFSMSCYICIKPPSGSKPNIAKDNLTQRCSTVSPTDARVNIASC